MQYRTLGSSELTISALGFGCWEMGGKQYGEVNDEEERRAVERAIDLGVTLFDAAAIYGYGHSEEVLGRALGSRRPEIVLVTKGGITWDEVGGRTTRTATREVLVTGPEDSLRRLGTDYVDLFLIHWPDGKTPEAEMMASLNELVRSGKTLHRRVQLHRRHAARKQAAKAGPRMTPRRRCALSSVLILTMHDDADLLLNALRAGAAGYILKTANETDLRAGIREALAGELPIDQNMTRQVLERLAHHEHQHAGPATIDRLSAREHEVLALVTRGYSNRAIAEELIVTQHTVKAHVEHILTKLKVGDRTQAAVKAMELGYIALHDLEHLGRRRS